MKKLWLFLVPVILYILTIRGSWDTPAPIDIDLNLSHSGQAFETSQERSRYALILSLYHDKLFTIDNYASMGTPDIGKIKGHYYSFFPPATSFLAIPLYVVGLKIGATQIMSFLISTIFAVFTLLMIIKFGQKLKLHWTIISFTVLSFGFATNAWGYSVTLYAHLLSAFSIITGLYLTLFGIKNHAAFSAALVWILYAFSVFVDFPNLFIFLPIVIILTLKFFEIKEDPQKLSIKLNWKYFFTPFIFIFCMGVYGYYNYIHYGNPLTLSNTIPRVRDLKQEDKSIPETGKDAVVALKTKNMIEGFRSFIVSSDRGIIIYSPVILLFIFGIGVLKSKEKVVEVSLLAIPAMCLTLYTMFGDPYGGWAFGSRYLIAIMPELLILAGIGLHKFTRNIPVKIIYTLIFMYSASISALAPLTTNVIPPRVEARYIGLYSTYIINWNMLQDNKLNSFIYNHIFKKQISGLAYYSFVLGIVVISGITLIWLPKKQHDIVSS